MADDKLWAAISKVLEAPNGEGNLKLQDRDAILLGGLRDLRESFDHLSETITDDVAEIKKEIDLLKRKNIILWVEKHPRAAITIVGAVILIFMFAHEISPLLQPLLEWLGLPVGL